MSKDQRRAKRPQNPAVQAKKLKSAHSSWHTTGLLHAKKTRIIPSPAFASAAQDSAAHSEDGREYAELPKDLFTVDGAQVAKTGDRVSPTLVANVYLERTGTESLSTEMGKTILFEDLRDILAKPNRAAVFGKAPRQDEIMEIIREMKVSRLLLAEMSNLYRKVPWAYEQSIVSASIAVLCLKKVTPEDPRIGQIWLAFAARDIGLSRIRPAILTNKGKLSAAVFREYLEHEVYSAVLVARALGSHLAVRFALRHHQASPDGRWVPDVQGYTAEELRCQLHLLQVADAFAAMTAPRSFRPTPYSVRAAIDQLIDSARLGGFDPLGVDLLLAHCRKEFNLHDLKKSARRNEPLPPDNFYGIA